MAAEQEDRWLDRLMRRRAAAQQDIVTSGACLDADTLAAWADHALTADELDAAQAHLSTCPRCLAVLAAVERTAPAAADTRPRRAWLGWLVPLTAAATAVGIWVLIPEQQVSPVAREAASTSIPTPSAPPAEPSFAPPVPQVTPRDEDFASRTRMERSEARKDARQDAGKAAEKQVRLGGAAADRAASADNAAPLAAAPPAPPSAAAVEPEPRSADALAESVVVTQERTLQRAAVIESVVPGGSVRWRVVESAAVERSTDGGKTWNRTSAPPGVTPGASSGRSAAARLEAADRTIVRIRAVDAANAFVQTSDGVTYSTADAGLTWAPVQEKSTAPF